MLTVLLGSRGATVLLGSRGAVQICARQQHSPFFSKITRNVKKLVGSPLTETEKRQENIDQVFAAATKNAPPIVKLLGGLVKPLVSKMSESIHVSQQLHEKTLEEAKFMVGKNERIRNLLGYGPLVFSPPHHSQQMVVNNSLSLRLQLFVVGSNGKRGAISLESDSDSIRSIEVNVDGQVIPIDDKSGSGKGFIDV